ncbi:hypothetical protein [Flexivirga sp. B27]
MNTTQGLNNKIQHNDRGRASLGFSSKVRAFWRSQQDAQELLIEKQTPWLSRH